LFSFCGLPNRGVVIDVVFLFGGDLSITRTPLLIGRRLLVKEQAKRMKLLDIPKHPWIVHYTNGKSLQWLEAATEKGK
jgi:hypothetical protein